MQPIIIEDNISIAANSVNANVINSNASLRRYLRSPFPAKGLFVCTQSAAGLTIDLDIGSKNVVANSNVRVDANLTEPLDTINSDWYADEGDQLVLRAANTTGGALSLRYRIVLTPWAEQLPPDCRVMQQGPISIAANAVDFQLLDGLRYERPPVDSLLEVFMSASATGLTRQLNIDTDSVAPPSAISPQNQAPRDPFDRTITGVEAPQDKLVALSVSNSTAGALNVWWRTKMWETYRT